MLPSVGYCARKDKSYISYKTNKAAPREEMIFSRRRFLTCRLAGVDHLFTRRQSSSRGETFITSRLRRSPSCYRFCPGRSPGTRAHPGADAKDSRPYYSTDGTTRRHSATERRGTVVRSGAGGPVDLGDLGVSLLYVAFYISLARRQAYTPAPGLFSLCSSC